MVVIRHTRHSHVNQQDSLINTSTKKDHAQQSLSQKAEGSFPGGVLLFSLECHGGKWRGIASFISESTIQVTFEGFPQLHVEQLLNLTLEGSANEWRMTGRIVELQGHRHDSPWQGTTTLTIASLTRTPTTNFLQLFQAQKSIKGTIGSDDLGAACGQLEEEPALIEYAKFGAMKCLQSQYQDRRTSTSVFSHPLTLSNQRGQIIRAIHDFPLGESCERLPMAIVIPGYGETKRDMLTLAYYLASNGFQVLRYDHTNHVGESEGNHADVTLGGMKQDFQAVCAMAQEAWPQVPRIGIASSLGFRVVLRAESETPSLSLLISMVGVVNLRQSVSLVHQEDIFAAYIENQCPDSANILGFNVKQSFLHNALHDGYMTLEDTLEDIRRLQTPIAWVEAENDAWVDGQDLAIVRNSLGNHLHKWWKIPNALHRLQENPKLARRAYRQLVAYCLAHTRSIFITPDRIHAPNPKELSRQRRKEKPPPTSQSNFSRNMGFWKDYLTNFQTVQECPDYVKLLDHVFHALGPISAGQSLLDVGCGNGNAGKYFLDNIRHHHPTIITSLNQPTRYIGIDLVQEALERAKAEMTDEYRGRCKSGTPFSPFIHFSWIRHDLNRPLPFPDNLFDRIVSNLVLGYTQNPQDVIYDLFRVLAPGGRMVLSNLKPDGDFSGIYQSLLKESMDSNHRRQARDLLNNYGKIRHAEKNGQFTFFDEDKWHSIVQDLGAAHVQISPTFSQQGFLIILEKPTPPPSSLALLDHPPRLTHSKQPSPFHSAA